MYGILILVWLTTRIPNECLDRKEDLCDRLLALSPDVSEGPDQLLMLPCARVSTYWDFASLPEKASGSRVCGHGSVFDFSSPQSHPFLEALYKLHQEFGLRFLMVPTAPWSLWLWARRTPTHFCEFWDAAAAREDLLEGPTACASLLAPDQLRTHAVRESLDYLLENLEECGIRRFRSFLKLRPESLSERFGPWARLLFRRAQGSDDMEMRWYKPPTQLSKTFYPQLEEEISSDETSSPLERLRSTLNNWEARLEARKCVLKGVRLSWKSSAKERESLKLPLTRPTRNARLIFSLVQECWMAHSSQSEAAFFEKQLEEVTLESLGLEAERDAQLDLFDPYREQRREAWDELLGRLRAKSTQQHPVRVGSFRPVATYVPERAYEWAEATTDTRLPMIPDPPRRPLWMFPEPLPLRDPRLQNEAEFCAYLDTHKALSTLELLTDLSDPVHPIERAYARVQNQWLFWDRSRKRAYLQGKFEAGQV